MSKMLNMETYFNVVDNGAKVYKPNLEEFFTFNLFENSKQPTNEWNKNIRKFTKTPKNQYGIVCGKKNNITVIDFDFYKEGYEERKMLFEEKFPNYLSMTRAVKTPSGGYHLYFQYEQDFRTTLAGWVDILSDENRYVVGAGSKIDGRKYKQLNDLPVNPMPIEIYDYFVKEVYQRKNKERYEDKVICDEYEFHLNDVEKLQLLKKIHHKEDYWTEYPKWLEFTRAMKYLNMQDEWEAINQHKPNYDYTNNMKIWDSQDRHYIGNVFKVFGKDINPYKYRPTLSHQIKPTEVIHKEYLGDIVTQDRLIVIKSDTGTGKTTTIKKYFKSLQDNDETAHLRLLSIVSRVSLAEEQHRAFNEHGIPTCIYLSPTKLKQGDNIVIQLESIISSLKRTFNYTDYVVFLDEINSIIKHLLTSGTLKKTRITVFLRLKHILEQANQVIATDAHTTDMCIEFLSSIINEDYKYIENTYNKFGNVKATEYTSYDEILEQIKKEEKYIVACDEVTTVEKLKREIQDDEILFLTKDTDIIPKFDDYKKIIYSPKVIYGIDSLMSRKVFLFYTTSSITADGMYQQMARCRNPIEVNYIFMSNRQAEFTKTLKEHWDDITAEDNEIEYHDNVEDKIAKFYIYLYSKYTYNNKCYQTNNKIHFVRMLKEKGFIMTEDKRKYKKGGLKKKELKQMIQQDLIDVNNEEKEDKMVKNMLEKNNEILKIPQDKVEEYADLLTSKNKIQQHFNVCNLLESTEQGLKDEVKEVDDFKIIKDTSSKNKIAFYKKFQEETHTTEKIADCITPVNKTALYDEYLRIFKPRNNIKRLDTTHECKKVLHSMGSKLYGYDYFEQVGRDRKDKKNYKIYEYNEDFFEYHRQLRKYRKNDTHENISMFIDEPLKATISKYGEALDRV